MRAPQNGPTNFEKRLCLRNRKRVHVSISMLLRTVPVSPPPCMRSGGIQSDHQPPDYSASDRDMRKKWPVHSTGLAEGTKIGRCQQMSIEPQFFLSGTPTPPINFPGVSSPYEPMILIGVSLVAGWLVGVTIVLPRLSRCICFSFYSTVGAVIVVSRGLQLRFNPRNAR